jgi:hypothetical protein
MRKFYEKDISALPLIKLYLAWLHKAFSDNFCKRDPIGTFCRADRLPCVADSLERRESFPAAHSIVSPPALDPTIVHYFLFEPSVTIQCRDFRATGHAAPTLTFLSSVIRLILSACNHTTAHRHKRTASRQLTDCHLTTILRPATALQGSAALPPAHCERLRLRFSNKLARDLAPAFQPWMGQQSHMPRRKTGSIS